ncbi:hypothetical protein SAMN04487996_107133 [Dyadobacter soli]|uniref:Uncharacterized protein n=1 Tax=Dyadobacter soli TaxID=659014 RepID=A0A1G7G5K6_9BACT|nr:hypothetical protein [Dyadobacter soli]SDE83434.1 hypothetical protein SAMN04487996_107133 [Dyadobacter soli]
MKGLENEKAFPILVKEAFSKINEFAGGNSLFYSKFFKSRAVVSSWKSGKVKPMPGDIIEFISVSTEVIRECQALRSKEEERQHELISEFNALVSA